MRVTICRKVTECIILHRLFLQIPRLLCSLPFLPALQVVFSAMRSRGFLISLFTTISLRTCHPLHIFLLFNGCSVVNSSSFSASTRCLAAFLCICVSAHYSSTLILLLLHPANHAHHGAFWRPYINSLILHHSMEWAEVMPTRLRGFGMTTSPSIDMMTIMARLTLQYPLALTTGPKRESRI